MFYISLLFCQKANKKTSFFTGNYRANSKLSSLQSSLLIAYFKTTPVSVARIRKINVLVTSAIRVEIYSDIVNCEKVNFSNRYDELDNL